MSICLFLDYKLEKTIVTLGILTLEFSENSKKMCKTKQNKTKIKFRIYPQICKVSCKNEIATYI